VAISLFSMAVGIFKSSANKDKATKPAWVNVCLYRYEIVKCTSSTHHRLCAMLELSGGLEPPICCNQLLGLIHINIWPFQDIFHTNILYTHFRQKIIQSYRYFYRKTATVSA